MDTIDTNKLTKRNAATVLRRAAALIETSGWHQGDYQNDNGCLCALGAIRVACGIKADKWLKQHEHPLIFSVYNTLRSELNGVAIDTWNDRKGTTKEDVVGAMRQTAAKLDHGRKLLNGPWLDLAKEDRNES